nr:DNA-(apurinic or apyrimidinic site) lyase [Ipomoea batatas]
MKRFFQPIQKDGSFKKPTLAPADKTTASSTESNPVDAVENHNDNRKKDPTKFLTWNANSFLLRIKNNWPEFINFVETFDPDVIAIQVLQSAF